MKAAFFEGQVRLLLKRCTILRDHVVSLKNIPRDIDNRRNEIIDNLQQLGKRLQSIITDPDFGRSELLKNQIDDYKRCCEELRILEYFPITLLSDYNENDYDFYKYSYSICKQINYPYLPPLVSGHSFEYYYAEPSSNIIGVPLKEAHFLLSLPDLIHELGHFIYIENRKTILLPFAYILHDHLNNQRQLLKQKHYSDEYRKLLVDLENIWLYRFITEYFCDIFATYVCGEAFGWAHLKLSMESQNEGIFTPSLQHIPQFPTHPSYDSRMRCILITLDKVNKTNDHAELHRSWEDYKRVVEVSPDNEYDFCYPESMLSALVEHSIKFCADIGVVPFYEQSNADDNVVSVMMMAWSEFNNDPVKYPDWERKAVDSFRKIIILL